MAMDLIKAMLVIGLLLGVDKKALPISSNLTVATSLQNSIGALCHERNVMPVSSRQKILAARGQAAAIFIRPEQMFQELIVMMKSQVGSSRRQRSIQKEGQKEERIHGQNSWTEFIELLRETK